MEKVWEKSSHFTVNMPLSSFFSSRLRILSLKVRPIAVNSMNKTNRKTSRRRVITSILTGSGEEDSPNYPENPHFLYFC
jgi:hypothetical protein